MIQFVLALLFVSSYAQQQLPLPASLNDAQLMMYVNGMMASGDPMMMGMAARLTQMPAPKRHMAMTWSCSKNDPEQPADEQHHESFGSPDSQYGDCGAVASSLGSCRMVYSSYMSDIYGEYHCCDACSAAWGDFAFQPVNQFCLHEYWTASAVSEAEACADHITPTMQNTYTADGTCREYTSLSGQPQYYQMGMEQTAAGPVVHVKNGCAAGCEESTCTSHYDWNGAGAPGYMTPEACHCKDLDGIPTHKICIRQKLNVGDCSGRRRN